MELKKYKLGDIAEIISGVAFQPSDICNEGVRILRGGNIQSQRIIIKDDDVFLPLYYINEENQVKIGDTILVASTGSVEVLGKAATCFDEMKNTQIGAFLRIIRPKEERYSMLISIALNSEYFAKYIQAQARGTSINNITIGYLKEFEIYYPKNYLPICDFYQTLEKKIALNRKINDNLEAMAKQLYDYWFVQFDFPNKEGKPYKSSGGKMVWNEKLKREIPEGWDIKSLNDIVKVKDGTHDSPKQQNEGYFLITSKHLLPTGINFKTAYYISEEDYKAINKRSKVDTNDILFSMIGTIGNKYLVSEETINFAIKNMALIKSSDNAKFMYFLWFYLSSPDYIRYEYNAISGSIQKFLSLDAMRNIPILFNEKILTLFNKKVSEICKLISNTNNENILLSKQRDELLPLLMNGQVSVNYD